MNRFLVYFKMNMKLLLRNKLFLFFLIIVPIISGSILLINSNSIGNINLSSTNEIGELDDVDTRAIYEASASAFVVKVYDASKTEKSEQLLNDLAYLGTYSVCRADAADMTLEEADAQAKKDAFDDRAGIIIYLTKDFDDAIANKDYESALVIYKVSDDERQELFLDDIANTMRALSLDVDLTSYIPNGKSVVISDDTAELTSIQYGHKEKIGYAIAILSLAFLMAGVCVSYTVIEEKKEMVYTRVLISNSNAIEYMISKIALGVVIALIQTVVVGVFITVVPGLDYGVSTIYFLAMIFGLGVIFCTLSIIMGIVAGDAMNANFAVFTVFTISNLLAGVYFPFDAASRGIKTLSSIMPQSWFMKIATQFISGSNMEALSMLLYVTVAYLIIFIGIGAVALKVKQVAGKSLA